MKAKLSMFRLSRKIVLILAGCIVLSGASAAFALYVGTEAILGPPESSISGLECTNVSVVKLRINGQRWVRKYVKTESTDGLVRLKTALRIASVFSKAEKADLYQVVVLDKNGPDQRAGIRGRAIGADVLFTPRPGDVFGMENAFQARYVEGKANAIGLFTGEKIEMPLEEIKSTIRAMDEHTDCVDPPLPAGEEAKASEHGEKKKSDHEKPKAKSEGHGEAEPAAHGETAEASGHDAAAPAGEAEGHDAEGKAEKHKKPHLPTFEDFAALTDDTGSHVIPDHAAAEHEEEAKHGAKPEKVSAEADSHDGVGEDASGAGAEATSVLPANIKAGGHETVSEQGAEAEKVSAEADSHDGSGEDASGAGTEVTPVLPVEIKAEEHGTAAHE